MRRVLTIWIIALTNFLATAQGRTLVQLKSFDQALQPYPAVSIVINDSVSVNMNDRGQTFLEIDTRNLPPSSIKVSDEHLEVESWNYSQGELEVILKPSSYRVVSITVKDHRNRPISGLKIKLNNDESVTGISDNKGKLNLPVPVNENLNQSGVFKIDGHRLLSQNFKDKSGIIKVVPLSQQRRTVVTDQSARDFQKFDFSNLDSVRSLTVFYAVIRHVDISQLDPDLKAKIDDKFQELMAQREDSLNNLLLDNFLERITSTSPVKEDVDLLIDQALNEDVALDRIKEAFDSKISLIDQKLDKGGLNLSAEDRQEILLDLDRLSEILRENEDKFFRNREQYERILTSLRNRLANIGELEQQLSLSERQRAEERKALNRKLVIAVAALVIFAIATILFILLSRKFKKQKNELALANAEINRINDHLEELVTQRTALLRQTNRELETFLYRSSHDLRRPLCTIMGLTNLASHHNGSSLVELCDKVTITVKKMDQMLDKLISVSEINHPSKFETIDFHDQVTNCIADRKEFMKDQNISFDCKIDSDITFKSYPHLIKMVLHNILDNAIWYSSLSANGHPAAVELRVYKENGSIKLKVSDNGPGVSNAVKAKIWDMFFVGHERTKGNGLGLYVVRKAVSALNGSVKHYCGEKGLTIFEVDLPQVHRAKKAELMQSPANHI